MTLSWVDTATHCNMLQHAATRCNTLQHAATRCNTPITCRWFEETENLHQVIQAKDLEIEELKKRVSELNKLLQGALDKIAKVLVLFLSLSVSLSGFLCAVRVCGMHPTHTHTHAHNTHTHTTYTHTHALIHTRARTHTFLYLV